MNHSIDVALTYASEQREYVETVAKELVGRSVNVFHAPFEAEQLWGEDLIPYLDRVFRELATLCVMFISREYVSKAWPSHERRAALARQLEEQSKYILPVRFDDSAVPGLNPHIAFMGTKDCPPTKLAELIRRKLSNAKS